MKNAIKWLIAVALLALAAGAQMTVPIPLGDTPPPEEKQPKQQGRVLVGTVSNKADEPLAKSIVYLKNTKTLTVKTFIAQDDGTYRFTALSPNIDYQVWAEFNGKKSDTKTLSQFDSRQQSKINLKVDVAK